MPSLGERSQKVRFFLRCFMYNQLLSLEFWKGIPWCFPFNPKFRKFRLVYQMKRTISVLSYWNIRDRLWRWSTLTGLVISDQNIPFHLTNCCRQYRSFFILVTRTKTKRAVAWVGSVQPECTVSLGTWNFRHFKPLNGKRPPNSTVRPTGWVIELHPFNPLSPNSV